MTASLLSFSRRRMSLDRFAREQPATLRAMAEAGIIPLSRYLSVSRPHENLPRCDAGKLDGLGHLLRAVFLSQKD